MKKKNKNGLKMILLFFVLIVISVVIIIASYLVLTQIGKDEQNTGDKSSNSQKIIKPPEGIYLGAYGIDGGFEEFESSIGYRVHISPYVPAYLDYQGEEKINFELKPLEFDKNKYQELWDEGYISFFELYFPMTLSDRTITIDNVIDGEIDDDLRKIADEISDFGKPIFFVYQADPQTGFRGYGADGSEERLWGEKQVPSIREKNPIDSPCDKYFYNQFGDSSELDGPERYKAMYKHIHQIFEDEINSKNKESNITWVMGAVRETGEDSTYECVVNIPYSEWYLGDDYVDWHSAVVYALQKEEQDWEESSFSDIFNPIIEEIQKVESDKPILITSFGVSTLVGPDRPDWLDDFTKSVKNYSRLGGIIFDQTPVSIDSGVSSINDNFKIEYGSDEAGILKEEIKENKNYWRSNITLESSGNYYPYREIIPNIFVPESELLPDDFSTEGMLIISDETLNYQGYFYLNIEKLGISNIPVQANVESRYKESYFSVIGKMPAHFRATKLPGDMGNVVVYGHSVRTEELGYFSDKTPVIFTYLFDLEVGDTIKINFKDQEFIYYVYKIEEVNPKRVDVLYDVAGERTLTLFTCSPPGDSTYRLVITARQIN